MDNGWYFNCYVRRRTTGLNKQNGANRQIIEELTILPNWFLPFYKEHFGSIQGGELYRVMEIAANKGKITGMPLYEYATNKVLNGRLLLCGDAAHMASPRTAVGAHTAVQDAAALYEAFLKITTKNDKNEYIDAALKIYEKPALQRAQQLFARSKEVSVPVSIQGWPYKERTTMELRKKLLNNNKCNSV